MFTERKRQAEGVSWARTVKRKEKGPLPDDQARSKEPGQRPKHLIEGDDHGVLSTTVPTGTTQGKEGCNGIQTRGVSQMTRKDTTVS